MSVYALHDPRTGACRYIGRAGDPHRRFKQHCVRSHSRRIRAWVDELRGFGMVPSMTPLLGESERYWIDRLAPDLNRTDGDARKDRRLSWPQRLIPVPKKAQPAPPTDERTQRRSAAASKAAAARWANMTPEARSEHARKLGKKRFGKGAARRGAKNPAKLGAAGGLARAAGMTKAERSESARRAALARHRKDGDT